MASINDIKENFRNDIVNRAQQEVLRSSSIIEEARGRGNLGMIGNQSVQTVAVYPVIDPITGESEEPVRPPDYFRCGDRIYPKGDPRAKPLKS